MFKLNDKVKVKHNGVETEAVVIGKRTDEVLEDEKPRVYVSYMLNCDRDKRFFEDDLSPVTAKPSVSVTKENLKESGKD